MTRIKKARAHLLIVTIITGVIVSGGTSSESPRESPVDASQLATLNQPQHDASTTVPEASPPTTSFQILGEYNDCWDLGTDVVIVYFEDHTTKIERQIESWVEQGYEPWVMFNSSQDYTGAYVTGKYDGAKHRGEIQRAADGSDFGVFDDGAYLVPNPNWLRYQKDFVKRAIDAGAKAIVAEEPEFFATAGYSPVFKKAWNHEYGTEWVDPNTNDRSRRMARRLMAILYQRHVSMLFKYADSCDPAVTCLVAAHSPFDYAINPMVFPHASVAALPEVDGFVAQVWSDTARSELTDPTRGGKDVEAVFHKAFLEYNYFWNLLRGTCKELIFLQDPKSDSEGFPWLTYRRWYEQTVVASALFDVGSFEVMPWPDRFFVDEAPQAQQTSCLSVMQAMRDLRNYRSDYSTRYAMLTSDAMLWSRPELEDAITGHMGTGVTFLRHGIPIDVIPIERVHEARFLDPYKVIFTWLPQSESQRAALVTWVKKGGNLVVLSGHPQDALFTELGITVEGTQIRTGGNTLTSCNDSHFLVKQLGKRIVVPECESITTYKAPSATAIYAAGDNGPAAAFEQKVGQGVLLFLGVSPDVISRSRFGANVTWGITNDLSNRDGHPFHELDRISINRGPYTIVYAVRDKVELSGLAIDVFDANLPLIESKVLAANEYALLYRVDVLPTRASVLYSSSKTKKLTRNQGRLSFQAAGPFQTIGVTTIYLPSGEPSEISAKDDTNGEDQLQSSRWSKTRRTLTVKYRHAPNRHPVDVVVRWRNE